MRGFILCFCITIIIIQIYLISYRLFSLDLGVYNQFGPGFHGIKRGEIIYVYECKKIIVRTRNIKNVTDDIPITYKDVYNNTHNKFLDPFTNRITNATVYHEFSNIFPVKFKIGEYWYCNNDFSKPCLNVEGLPFKFSSIGIDFEPNFTYENITLNNPEERKSFEEDINEASSSEYFEQSIGAMINSNSSDIDLSTLNIDGLQSKKMKSDANQDIFWSWYYYICLLFIVLFLCRIIFIISVFFPYSGWIKTLSMCNMILIFFVSKDFMLEIVDKNRKMWAKDRLDTIESIL